MLRKALKAIFLPPLALFLLAILGLALAGRRPRLGRAIAAVAVGLLVLLSVPIVATALLLTLETAPAFDSAAVPKGAAIVVLGSDLRPLAPEYGHADVGGLTLERVRFAAHVAKVTDLPVLVCGGVTSSSERSVAFLMARTLEDEFGVEVRWLDERSTTTRENVEEALKILRDEGVEAAVVVTHAWHMPRAVAEFEGHLDVIPAPMGAHAWPGWRRGAFVPSAAGLRDSSWAIHEWAGRFVYAITR